MPTFILAGVQRSLVNQVRKVFDGAPTALGGWSAIILPAEKNTESSLSFKQVDEVFQQAAQDDGAHIFGLSNQRNRDAVEQAINPYFRFRWFDLPAILKVGSGQTDPLLSAIHKAIEEEQMWLDRVKPKTSASPLILPPIFKPLRDLESLWRLARSYNDLGNISAVERLVVKFEREHRRKVEEIRKDTPWVDEKRWIWNDNGERHGEARFPEGWKFSYCLPDRFHFDVQSQGRTNRIFHDINGKPHALGSKGYVNVTAHGLIRGS